MPLGSCHHNRWLQRRNCTYEEDFVSQSQVLMNRLLQKGYARLVLDREIETVWSLERKILVSNSPKDNQYSAANMRMSLDFNVQNKKFEKIVKKYWPILKQDRVLGPPLPECPQFIYRKAPS